MPFRSESEHMREQLRRVEETTRGLLEEKADLDRQLGTTNLRRLWGIALAVTIVGSFGLGYSAGVMEGSASLTRSTALWERSLMEDYARERTAQLECRSKNAKTTSDTATCELGKAQARLEAARATAPGSCNCDPRDPLCSCDADQKVFDRNAAIAVLGGAPAKRVIDGCFKPKREISFHTTFSFAAATGSAESVVIDSVSNDAAISATEKTCVENGLRNAVKVPKFTGANVHVGKSWTASP